MADNNMPGRSEFSADEEQSMRAARRSQTGAMPPDDWRSVGPRDFHMPDTSGHFTEEDQKNTGPRKPYTMGENIEAALRATFEGDRNPRRLSGKGPGGLYDRNEETDKQGRY